MSTYHRRPPRSKDFVPITETAAAALAASEGSIGGFMPYTLYAAGGKTAMGEWAGAECTRFSVAMYPATVFTPAHWHVVLCNAPPGVMAPFYCYLPAELSEEEAHLTAAGMMDIANLRRIHE
jgi:hypothetical protein